MRKKIMISGIIKERDNKGFSLIEVLVCVAILVIISIPIFQTFSHSAYNTKKAYSTQQITEYAQTTMETIKQTPVDKLRDVLITTGTETVVLTPHTDDPSAPDKLFETITYEQSGIEVGGEIYNMKAVLDPLPYSMGASPTASPAITAEDINVIRMAKVNEVNGLIYPLISDEINSHEAGSGALNDMLAMVPSSKLNNLGTSDNDRLKCIYTNTTKKVIVNISDGSSEVITSISPTSQSITNQITVSCDVIYEMDYNSVNIRKEYNVYKATFEMEGTIDSTGKVSWDKGGKIYIFAKAYNDQNSLFSGLKLGKNSITITNSYGGSKPLDIYLVRGYYGTKGTPDTRNGVNFDTVEIDSNTYSYVSSSDTLTGAYQNAKTNFYTNIKGKITSRELLAADFEQTIGNGEQDLRCYYVRLQFTDQNGKLVTDLESTKKID